MKWKTLFERVLTDKIRRETEKRMIRKTSAICKNYERLINKLLACSDKDKYCKQRDSILKTQLSLLKKLEPLFRGNSALKDAWVSVMLSKCAEDYDARAGNSHKPVNVNDHAIIRRVG